MTFLLDFDSIFSPMFKNEGFYNRKVRVDSVLPIDIIVFLYLYITMPKLKQCCVMNDILPLSQSELVSEFNGKTGHQ